MKIMNKNKLETISNLFENKEIRSIWDSEKEEYYFSVVDVIGALTESERARKYWNDIKADLNKGYTNEWIKQRSISLVDRFKLTDV